MINTIGKAFAVERGDQEVPRWWTRVNQWLTERGISAPWFLDRDDILEFWRSRTAGSGGGNDPLVYLSKDAEPTEYLATLLGRIGVGRTESILEIGCNVGTNLERLRLKGWHSLGGLEANTHAVAVLRERFPDLPEVCDVRVGPAEMVLPELKSGSFDVVFTMAVLMHLPPESNSVFDEMARVSRRWIVTIELEHVALSYIFPRRYDRMFSPRGYVQRLAEPVPAMRRYEGYVTRVFERSPGY
jgi:SAM-dependent methyltransferase